MQPLKIAADIRGKKLLYSEIKSAAYNIRAVRYDGDNIKGPASHDIILHKVQRLNEIREEIASLTAKYFETKERLLNFIEGLECEAIIKQVLYLRYLRIKDDEALTQYKDIATFTGYSETHIKRLARNGIELADNKLNEKE